MDILEKPRPLIQSWRLITTAPQSGAENMRYDAELLDAVERGLIPPTLRLFRFDAPTVTFGRLQKREDVAAFVPSGWPAVQRPTGGGIVFHEGDLCLSLAWAAHDGPIPGRPQEKYQWIHQMILESLGPSSDLRLSGCCDVVKDKEPFSIRRCFTQPVGYDLLHDGKKIVGGALRCTHRATLYQGSLQLALSPLQEEEFKHSLQSRLNQRS